MKNAIVVFLIVVGVIFIAGCTDSGKSGAPASTPAEEVKGGVEQNVTGSETGQNGNAAETKVIDVEIRNFKYIPQNLTVKVGRTVRWTNFDSARHDVVGSGIKSEYLEKGESFSYTFEKEGTYQYICTLHPWMEGEVIAQV
jgi:plastocyanin